MADPTPTRVLNFTDDLETIPLTLFGKKYTIRHPDDCSPKRYLTVQRWIAQLSPLLALDPWTPEQEAAADTLTMHICIDITGAAVDVLARLKITQRVQIIDAFTLLRLKTSSGATEANPATTAPRSRSTSSSRRSRGSTAARRGTGGRKRPSH